MQATSNHLSKLKYRLAYRESLLSIFAVSKAKGGLVLLGANPD
jgi:hypothetical protein